MKSINYLLATVLAIGTLQTGCSADRPSQSQKKENQTVVTETQATKSSGTHYILGGMTKEQGETLGKAIQEAQVEMAPILKGSELEKQGKWSEAIQHYQALLESKEFGWNAKRGLARAFEAMGDYEKAIFYLEQSPPKDYAKPEWEKELSRLKAKAAQAQQ